MSSAHCELQRMAVAVLHCIHTARRILRAQHVCRRGRGELSPMPRGAGEGGEAAASSEASETNGEEEET